MTNIVQTYVELEKVSDGNRSPGDYTFVVGEAVVGPL